ncbi:MAG: hypothetical protein QOF85_1686 [Solirubrobacterales bacterium]|jgi:hypothetical protein|nr:hypothetical protein [Solirubrobacterales bacterium]
MVHAHRLPWEQEERASGSRAEYTAGKSMTA